MAGCNYIFSPHKFHPKLWVRWSGIQRRIYPDCRLSKGTDTYNKQLIDYIFNGSCFFQNAAGFRYTTKIYL